MACRLLSPAPSATSGSFSSVVRSFRSCLQARGNTRALRKEQPQNNSSTMSSLLFGGNDSRSFPEVIEKFVSTPTSTDDNQQTESLNYILFGAY